MLQTVAVIISLQNVSRLSDNDAQRAQPRRKRSRAESAAAQKAQPCRKRSRARTMMEREAKDAAQVLPREGAQSWMRLAKEGGDAAAKEEGSFMCRMKALGGGMLCPPPPPLHVAAMYNTPRLLAMSTSHTASCTGTSKLHAPAALRTRSSEFGGDDAAAAAEGGTM
jgi:hypothetical protein